jgi:predicted O-linked N-acetylglucosamine transferase (SPINDLY family)
VPVVTLAGQGFASRVAASVANDAGAADQVCGSLAEYGQKAEPISRFNQPQKFTNADLWPIAESILASEFAETICQI